MRDRSLLKFLILTLAVTVSVAASTAKAEQISCQGDYFFYHFNVTALIAGNRVPGNMKLLVTNGSSVVREGSIPVSSSDISLGKHVKFSGKDAAGAGGAVDTAFDVSSRTYTGRLVVQSSEGGATVDVTCTVRPSPAM